MTFTKINPVPRQPIDGGRTRTISITTWSGETKQLQSASLNAEKDQNGETFYKISGSYRDELGRVPEETFMVAYHYNKREAMCHYIGIVEQLLEAQEGKEKQP